MDGDITGTVLREIRDEIKETREGLRSEMQQVRNDLQQVRNDLRGEIHQTRDELRGEIEQTRVDLGGRIDETNERFDRHERRQTESEIRLATELVALAGMVHGLRDDLREDRKLRGRVDDHERRIGALEKERGEPSH